MYVTKVNVSGILENMERDVQRLKDEMSVSKPTVFGLYSYLPDEVYKCIRPR